MPVYLFTYHAYRSWMPDRARGFVQKGRGVQPTNDALAEAYRRAAHGEAFEFDALTQIHLISKARAVCAGDGWRSPGLRRGLLRRREWCAGNGAPGVVAVVVGVGD